MSKTVGKMLWRLMAKSFSARSEVERCPYNRQTSAVELLEMKEDCTQLTSLPGTMADGENSLEHESKCKRSELVLQDVAEATLDGDDDAVAHELELVEKRNVMHMEPSRKS